MPVAIVLYFIETTDYINFENAPEKIHIYYLYTQSDERLIGRCLMAVSDEREVNQ